MRLVIQTLLHSCEKGTEITSQKVNISLPTLSRSPRWAWDEHQCAVSVTGAVGDLLLPAVPALFAWLLADQHGIARHRKANSGERRGISPNCDFFSQPCPYRCPDAMNLMSLLTCLRYSLWDEINCTLQAPLSFLKAAAPTSSETGTNIWSEVSHCYCSRDSKLLIL